MASICAHLEIFQHGEIGEDLAALGDMADAHFANTVGRPACDIDAIEKDRAARQLFDAMDGADQRALARSIGADDGHDLARGDLERDIGQRLGVAIVEVEVVDLQERAAHGGSASPR